MARNLLIAGGNSGIGLATAKLLAKSDNLTCALRRPAEIEHLGVKTLPFDATDTELSLELPDSLDGLVYFPGTINLKPFSRLSDEDFLTDLQVNLLGGVRLIRQALPSLKRSVMETSSIVLFSTVAVDTGMPFHTSVAAAKGAVEGFGRSLAAELAPKIRVNLIAPSLTNTPLAESLLSSDQKVEASKNRHPLKQVGEPEDIAAAVDFLLSERSNFMTGQVLRIDGGISSLKLL